MATRRRPGWQQRKRSSHGPGLFSDETAPEAGSSGRGVMGHFSWRFALGIIGLGMLAALVAHYAC